MKKGDKFKLFGEGETLTALAFISKTGRCYDASKEVADIDGIDEGLVTVVNKEYHGITLLKDCVLI